MQEKVIIGHLSHFIFIRFRYLTHLQAAMAQRSLCICAVLPVPLLLKHTQCRDADEGSGHKSCWETSKMVQKNGCLSGVSVL